MKIDFYILTDGNHHSRLQLACRLVEKAYKNQHRIYLHTENEADAYTLDEMLWSYREDSFLPHNLYGEGPKPPPPIQIGYGVIPERHRDILINLSSQIPEFFKRFNRVLEIVGNDPAAQELARVRFKTYRTEGAELNTHKLESYQV